MVFEQWSGPVATSSNGTLRIHGNQRSYLTMSHETSNWGDLRYDKLRLLGKTLRVSIDVSGVGCGCNAALYLVAMPQPDEHGSRYCDIQTPEPRQ